MCVRPLSCANAGSLIRAPRDARAKEQHEHSQELTKSINQRNEASTAGKATSEGKRLQVVSS